MKKTLLSLMVFLAVASLSAQEEGIIHTVFEPNLSIVGNHGTLSIDLDQDGTKDMELFIDVLYSTGEQDVFMTTLSLPWHSRLCLNPDYSFVWADQNENDTIIPCLNCWAEPNASWQLFWGNNQDWLLGFRKEVNEQNYYAWVKIHTYKTNDVTAHVEVQEMAYCTIPDYPLRWGQTTYVGVQETELNSFADIHPNPTTDRIIIKGDNLLQAEVYDVLGQIVYTLKSEGVGMTCDLTGQPAGMYFISIIDKNGKHCLKKVVKQ